MSRSSATPYHMRMPGANKVPGDKIQLIMLRFHRFHDATGADAIKHSPADDDVWLTGDYETALHEFMERK